MKRFILSLILLSSQAQAQTPQFFHSLEAYLVAAESGSIVRRISTLQAVKREIFSHTESAHYAAELTYLDRLQPAHPRAILDLGVALQQRWETQYGATLSLVQAEASDRAETDQKFGFALGMAALLATLSRHPENFPRYCLLFRGLFPVAGMLYFGGSSAPSQSSIPPAPAHFLRLGIARSEELDAERLFQRQSLQALQLTASSIALGTLATDITALIMAVRAGSTVARLNPLALLVGTVAMTLFEEGAEFAIEHAETERHEANFIIAVQNLRGAARGGNTAKIYARAQRLATRAAELAAFRNRELWLAGQAAAQSVASGELTAQEANRRLASRMRYALRDLGTDTEEQGYWVRGLLDNGFSSEDLAGEERLAGLAQAYEQRFARWASARERATSQHWNDTERATAWNEFLHGADLASSQALVDRAQRGQVPQHPSVVLWSAVAVIRSLGLDYLEATADALTARIARNRLVLGSGNR